MRRYLDRWALGLAVSGWLLLLVGLWISGLDPTGRTFSAAYFLYFTGMIFMFPASRG